MKLKLCFTYIILTFLPLGPLSAATVVELPLNAPALQNASFAFYAKYVNGDEIFEHNKNLRLTPASVVKLFTAAAALDAMSADTRFETKVYLDGEINFWGTLNGNIYIRGGGDPTLGSERIDGNIPADKLMENWAQKIKDLGIKKINGSIYADSTLFKGDSLPRKTMWEDMGNYYGATSDALSINDNLFYIYFKPTKGSAVAEVDHIFPEVEDIKITSFVTVDSSVSGTDGAYAFGAPNQTEIYLRGKVPPVTRSMSLKASLPNPPLFAAQNLKEKLENAGIKVKGPAAQLQNTPDYSGKKLITTHLSPQLSEILQTINRKSFNLYAEVILKNTSIRKGGDGSTENGVEQIENFLIMNEIPATDIRLYDGSGLAGNSFVNAQTIVSFLEKVTEKSYFDIFYSSMLTPDEGEETYFSRMFFGTNVYNNLRIKTGTMNGVRAYAGYTKDTKGRMIAFAFIANNYTAKTSDISKIFNAVLKQLATLDDTPPVKQEKQTVQKNNTRDKKSPI
ncbi:D-alanyl-D-alanine carboxypeptidase/D-alanyl-D-alanine-endopeptidase (penicillin-binding protein 4) [Elusimicrobium posterum]|uniref:D-alanyl-D-alanine carboxypeptidase/D-alanyl-D-alanine endopeptidase n=1 Tax=Elusimicrobium posterum TaxID=3116653 RepID=UPI003C70BEE0